MRWYSWVEFVADEPQPAKIMFSHWWGGRFSDFMPPGTGEGWMDGAMFVWLIAGLRAL